MNGYRRSNKEENMLDPEIIAMTHTLTEKQRDYMMARYSAKEK